MGSKLSRRSFLKLTGVAVGSGLAYSKFGGLKLSALSPAEATGTDDEKWKHTACALCLMCPMQVKVKNGKIVDVRGEDIYPWKGRVCAKAYGGIWGRVYAPDRIIYPLKRVGKRGEGKFVRCSWDEVITNFSKKLKEYMDEGHPEAFEIWWGCPVQADNMYFLHYFSRIMGCSISYMHGQICFGDHTSEKSVTFGGSRAGDLVNGTADYINTKYAVIAAQNFPGTVFAPGTQCGASAFWPVYLKAKENGIVLDVGGTTSDVGVITQSFPRESSLAVEIGGVRTNFRMPDLVSIGLGGGTIIRKDGQEIKVGPDSVGYRLTEEALVFGGKTVTTTDIAVRLGLADIGDKEKVNNIPLEFAQCAQEKIMSMVEEAIDKMKVSKDPLPLILVGGGGIIINGTLSGVSEVLRPENFGVANALGAAIAQVSGEVDKIYSLTDMTRDQALDDARKLAKENAVRAGANPDTVTIVQQEDVPLAYLPGNATRIRVKAAGSLKK